MLASGGVKEMFGSDPKLAQARDTLSSTASSLLE